MDRALIEVAMAGAISLAVFIYIAYAQLNQRRPVCARCSGLMPLLRKPTSLGKMLLGRGTCPICGAEIDKWGLSLSPAPAARRRPGSTR